MNIIVIHELDHDDFESSVIGVADNKLDANKIIEEYYGKNNIAELKYRYIGESNLEYEKILEINNNTDTFKVTVTLEWFKINEV